MRPTVLLTRALLFAAFGVTLLLVPTCKAQEISSDQFNEPNTEPFEKPRKSSTIEASKTDHKTTRKQGAVVAKRQSRKSGPAQSSQLVAAGDLSQTVVKDAAPIPTPGKPKE